MAKLESFDELLNRITHPNVELPQIRYGETLKMGDTRISWAEYGFQLPPRRASCAFFGIQDDGALLRLDLTPISREFNDLFAIIETPFNDRIAILEQLKTRKMPVQLSLEILLKQDPPDNWSDATFTGRLEINYHSLKLTSDCAGSSDYQNGLFEVHTIFPIGEEDIVFSNVDALRASDTSLRIFRSSESKS